jgi:hypothetical protein
LEEVLMLPPGYSLELTAARDTEKPEVEHAQTFLATR